MMATLIVIGAVCLVIMINAPGLLGNLFIWIMALGIVIGASCWLGMGGFIIAAPIAVWIAYSAASDRTQNISQQEQRRLEARRKAGLRWFQ